MLPPLPAKPCVRIIRPSGKGGEEFIAANIASIEAAGLRVLYSPPPDDRAEWPYTAGSIPQRLDALSSALLEQDSQALLCARGGYGCSDLLPLLPWKRLRSCPPKWLVGFSDITALSCALWKNLGWPSIHGPMPASPLWGQNTDADTSQLLSLLGQRQKQGHMALTPVSKPWPPTAKTTCLKGWALGGCFSVLSNLVGTPYLPSAKGAILFLEDVGENPGRLLRYFNQLVQSGFLDGVQAIVWGNLSALNSELSQQAVKAEIAKRAAIPMWSSEDFGHISPNFPFVIGAEVELDSAKGQLSWHYNDAKAG